MLLILLTVQTKTHAGLVGLDKLRYLDLSFVTQGGGFPEFIGKLVSLEVLVLDSNNMAGGLPGAAFENLRNLQELSMSVNNFNGNLPESLFSLPRLKILVLSVNLFVEPIPISSPRDRFHLKSWISVTITSMELCRFQPLKASGS